MAGRSRGSVLLRLHELPDELIRHIATYLYGNEVVQFSLVCRSFYRIAQDPWLWRLMYLKQYKQLPADEASITDWRAAYAKRYREAVAKVVNTAFAKYHKSPPIRRQLAPIVKQALRPRFRLELNGVLVVVEQLHMHSLSTCLIVPIPPHLPHPSALLATALRRPVPTSRGKGTMLPAPAVAPVAAGAAAAAAASEVHAPAASARSGTPGGPPGAPLVTLQLQVAYQAPVGPSRYLCSLDNIQTWTTVFQDKVVRVRVSPNGMVVLLSWVTDDSPAQLLLSVPHEALIQTVVPRVASIFDDVDREFGLHDYTVLLCLRTAEQVRYEGRWDKVFTRKPARKGLPMIDFPLPVTPTELSGGGLALPWSTGVGIGGHVPGLLLADVAVYDERARPLWAHSAPALFTKHEMDALDMRAGSATVLRADVVDRNVGALTIDVQPAAKGSRHPTVVGARLSLRTDLINRLFQTSY